MLRCTTLPNTSRPKATRPSVSRQSAGASRGRWIWSVRGFNGGGGGKVEAIVRKENVLWHSIGVIRLHQCVIEERLKCGVGKSEKLLQ